MAEMDLYKNRFDSIRFFSLFCLSVVIFVCISNIQSTLDRDYKLYYTFLLVLLFAPKLIESWIMADPQDDLRALLKDSGEPTGEQAIAKAREVVDRLDKVTLNIAVTGETGAGKSSFVNAIRGLQDTDEGAAPTGVTETTMEPTMYPHPTMPNVNLWDLPGIGSPTFKAQTYMNDVKYQNYDFFIIVSASRFMKNDVKLANEIKKNKINFYFVHTKTDNDIAIENKEKVGEDTTLEKIRKECLKNLSKFRSPPLFLISSHYLERFDFKELVIKLRDDLPDLKKYVMIMSLPVYSNQSLEEKYIIFKKVAWAVAITSGATAAAPAPAPAAYDVAIVVSFLTKCYHSFGLDDGPLQKLSKRVHKQTILEEVKKSGLVREIAISTSRAMSMVAIFGEAGVIDSKCILVPGAGNIAAYLLLKGVTELYRVAKRVIEMAEIP